MFNFCFDFWDISGVRNGPWFDQMTIFSSFPSRKSVHSTRVQLQNTVRIFDVVVNGYLTMPRQLRVSNFFKFFLNFNSLFFFFANCCRPHANFISEKERNENGKANVHKHLPRTGKTTRSLIFFSFSSKLKPLTASFFFSEKKQGFLFLTYHKTLIAVSLVWINTTKVRFVSDKGNKETPKLILRENINRE